MDFDFLAASHYNGYKKLPQLAASFYRLLTQLSDTFMKSTDTPEKKQTGILVNWKREYDLFLAGFPAFTKAAYMLHFGAKGVIESKLQAFTFTYLIFSHSL